MGLRRANRAIETFDISLMAVVTKAMGAFLVLMLLLVPSYVAMPAMQRQLADDEAASRALEQATASLTSENRALAAAQVDRSQREQLRRRIAALEQENKQLARPAPPALIVFFDWNGCAADAVDFYIAADVPGWPDVRQGPQPLPAGVLEYPQQQLATQLSDLVDADSALKDFINRRAARQRLWAINTLQLNTNYTLYAKVGRLNGDCDVATKGLLTASDTSDWRSSIGTTAALASKSVPGVLSNKGHRIVFLERLNWDGKMLHQQHAFDNPHEQDKIDARFGHD